MQCPFREALQTAGWDVDQLAPAYAALASAAFAIGALVSFDSAIIGPENQPITSYLDVERMGPDLRTFGVRRQEAFSTLKAVAIRRAQKSEALFESTVVSAATCWLIDYLEEVGPSELLCCSMVPQPSADIATSADLSQPRNGIWLQAYLQQLRIILSDRPPELVDREASVYACNAAMDLFGRWPSPHPLYA